MEINSLSAQPPRVSVGLPIYNGTAYAHAAIDSILSQSFGDFELIISDNASTDDTPDICRAYAARDARIRFIRHEVNRGAAWNFNFVFGASRGRYFKWAAHDDVLGREYLEECVAVLDKDPTVVLSYPRILRIDEHGSSCRELGTSDKVASHDPAIRFADQILTDNSCEHVFGLLRSEVLRKTALMGGYAVADRVLLCELALRGRFYQVPKALFHHRDHPGRFVRKHLTAFAMNEWFSGATAATWSLPGCNLFKNYLAAISKSGVDLKTRGRCYMCAFRWLLRSRRIQSDFHYATRRLVRFWRKRESMSAFVEHVEAELKQTGENRIERSAPSACVQRNGLSGYPKTAGDCPDFAQSAEQNGTVPLSRGFRIGS